MALEQLRAYRFSRSSSRRGLVTERLVALEESADPVAPAVGGELRPEELGHHFGLGHGAEKLHRAVSI